MLYDGYVMTHLISQLRLAAGSAYRLADPTSTLCDTHLFVVDYVVNHRLQYAHQQVRFKRAVLWIKEEFIAEQVEGRNRAGLRTSETAFRAQFTTDHLDPAVRRGSPEKMGKFIWITVAVHLSIWDRGEELRFLFPTQVQTSVCTDGSEYPWLQFDDVTTLLDGVRIPPGLPQACCSDAQVFTAIYCHPELRK
jgi:hypothetical protein